ncbi:MAG: hypothetical protein FJ217_06810 [Ignavibacteria bacterium]|nr:hypothetical protein [Ignavibacteria bacterium]
MLEKPNKFRVALISGAAIGAVSGIPGLNLLNCCCCAGVWLGGVLAMYLYRQEFTEGMPPLESSDALLLGLMSGVVGAFVATFLSVAILVVFGPIEAEFLRSLFEKGLDRLAEEGTLPSDMVDQFRDQLESAVQDSARVSSILGNLFIELIVYPIFAILGALLGYAFFRPKTPPQATPVQ